MNQRKRRLRSIQTELEEIYLDLFGAKYVPGLQEIDKSEFNSIIQTFRERLFTIRELQGQREKKEAKKDYKRSALDIKVNHEIRDDIKKCEDILREAVRRKQSDLKNKNPQAYRKIMANRQKTLKNCFELLSDVKQMEEGESYRPPERQQTLQDLKRRLVDKNDLEEEWIDVEDQQKFEKYKKKDMLIDEGLEEVINVNREVKAVAKAANQKIDETNVKIQQNLVKVNQVEEQVQKGQRDLEEVLKHYRRPNKLCLDITLVLLLLALIGVIINMIKNG